MKMKLISNRLMLVPACIAVFFLTACHKEMDNARPQPVMKYDIQPEINTGGEAVPFDN